MPTSILRSLSIFSVLSETDIDELATMATPAHHPPEEILFQEGDEGLEFYVLVSGRIRIERQDNHGTSQVLAYLEDGAIFGEAAILDHLSRSASAITDTECSILTFESHAIQSWAVNNPASGVLMLGRIGVGLLQRLQSANEYIMSLESDSPAKIPGMKGYLWEPEHQDIDLLNHILLQGSTVELQMTHGGSLKGKIINIGETLLGTTVQFLDLNQQFHLIPKHAIAHITLSLEEG